MHTPVNIDWSERANTAHTAKVWPLSSRTHWNCCWLDQTRAVLSHEDETTQNCDWSSAINTAKSETVSVCPSKTRAGSLTTIGPCPSRDSNCDWITAKSQIKICLSLPAVIKAPLQHEKSKPRKSKNQDSNPAETDLGRAAENSSNWRNANALPGNPRASLRSPPTTISPFDRDLRWRLSKVRTEFSRVDLEATCPRSANSRRKRREPAKNRKFKTKETKRWKWKLASNWCPVSARLNWKSADCVMICVLDGTRFDREWCTK